MAPLNPQSYANHGFHDPYVRLERMEVNSFGRKNSVEETYALPEASVHLVRLEEKKRGELKDSVGKSCVLPEASVYLVRLEDVRQKDKISSVCSISHQNENFQPYVLLNQLLQKETVSPIFETHGKQDPFISLVRVDQ